MKIAYIRWQDACTQQADSAEPVPAIPGLAELQEVGFLLAENDEAVVIGMERSGDDTYPGRWRLHIPRVAIKEMRVADVGKLFPCPRKRHKA
jgi:hypothetical protein